MIDCPECNGEGENKINYPEMTTSDKPPEYRIEKCRLCRGKGEINKLQLGIYEARGGLPSVKARGYS